MCIYWCEKRPNALILHLSSMCVFCGINVNTVFLPAGVYAWIGINFVLGRFDHAEYGECEDMALLMMSLVCPLQRMKLDFV